MLAPTSDFTGQKDFSAASDSTGQKDFSAASDCTGQKDFSAASDFTGQKDFSAASEFKFLTRGPMLFFVSFFFAVFQIYDEYGWEGLEAVDANEIAKQTVGVHFSHPEEVRTVRSSAGLGCFHDSYIRIMVYG